MKNSYDNIIDLPHHISKTHPPMSTHDRAAQFSPFAALTGFGDTIKESDRQTGKFVELSEDEKMRLDNIFASIGALISRKPEVCLTFFKPDETKDGGEYVTVTGQLTKVDTVYRRVILNKDFTVDIDKINDIFLTDKTENSR